MATQFVFPVAGQNLKPSPAYSGESKEPGKENTHYLLRGGSNDRQEQ